MDSIFNFIKCENRITTQTTECFYIFFEINPLKYDYNLMRIR